MTAAPALAVPDGASMHRLGRWLAGELRAGDLILLVGPLGAGKTTFAQGVGAGLAVPERLTSPTFVLAREHLGGRLPLVHADAYRLGPDPSPDQLQDLELDLAGAVTLVEWGHLLGAAVDRLAEGHLVVGIDRAEDPADETRLVRFTAHGPAWADRRQQLAAAVIDTAPGARASCRPE